MIYNIIYDQAIPQQLKSIKNYINLSSSTMGEIVVQRIRDKMRSLSKEPARGIPLKNKVSFTITRDVRFIIESGYNIFYFIESDFIYIYLVIHSAQDYTRYFDFLRE